MSIVVTLLSFIFFLLFQARGISVGDSGDLVSAAATFGVPHPPGYPLYTFLGWIVHFVPVSTIAWRLALLSSLPHAIAIGCIYFFVVKITKRPSAGFFASACAAGNYLVFMYSVTPEVFALMDLFVILLLYFAWQWVESGKIRYLFWESMALGLAVFHHQLVIFMSPALIFALWVKRSRLKKIPIRTVVTAVSLLAVGFLPYLYVLLAARGTSIINWDRVVSIDRFIRLLSRADYGTFKSGAFFGAAIASRFVQIKLFGQFIWFDFGVIGVGLILLGWFTLWRKERKLFWLFFFAIGFMGPAFFFYASFPIVNSFILATYERFLLPSYTILFVVMGVGFSTLIKFLKRFLLRALSQPLRLPVLGAVCVLLFLYPLSGLGVTTWRFWGIQTDMTAEHLGEDLITSLPQGSLLILDRDTALFTTQYVRYVENVRPDVILLHANRLWWDDYREVVARTFPKLHVVGGKNTFSMQDFVNKNSKEHRIFSNTKYAVGNAWLWVPYGLVFELQPAGQSVSVEDMKDTNVRIWQTIHDPTKGILSRYNHLMLSDVRDVYAVARLEFGKALLRANDLSGAHTQFVAAIALGGDTQTPLGYMYDGLTQLFSHNCPAAINALKKADATGLVPDKDITLYEAVTYRDCEKNSSKAQELFDAYKRQTDAEQTPLQGL